MSTDTIPQPAQRALRDSESTVEQAITQRDEAASRLARFDHAIARAAERLSSDETAFRGDVREIIRDALGAADDSLLDRIRKRVAPLFRKSAPLVGPDPRIATILHEEAAGARATLAAQLQQAEAEAESAAIAHDAVRLDVLAAGISSHLSALGPLILGRDALLDRRRTEVDSNVIRPSVPGAGPEVSVALRRLADELMWTRGAHGEASFARAAARMQELGYEVERPALEAV